MKRLLFILALASAPAAWAQLSPSCASTVIAGANLACSVNLSGGAPAAAQVNIILPGIVGPPTITAGTASVAAQKQAQCSLAALCLVYGINQTTIAPGELLHLSIPVPTGASGNFNVCISAPVESDANANSLPVTAGPCVAVSILPAINKCDVNGDGLVDATDVAFQITGTLAVPQTAADLNRDGAINILDVEIVIRAVLGLGCSAI